MYVIDWNGLKKSARTHVDTHKHVGILKTFIYWKWYFSIKCALSYRSTLWKFERKKVQTTNLLKFYSMNLWTKMSFESEIYNSKSINIRLESVRSSAWARAIIQWNSFQMLKYCMKFLQEIHKMLCRQWHWMETNLKLYKC